MLQILIMKWSKRRILLLSSVFVGAVVLVTCAVVLTQLKSSAGPGNYLYKGHLLAEEALVQKDCSTKECVLEAARVISRLDPSADPCQDFFNFTCGNFIRSNSLPEGWDSYGSIDVLEEEIDRNIKGILAQPIRVNGSSSLEATKTVYQTCTDLTEIERLSVRDLRRVLSSGEVGVWPLLEGPDWKECRPDVEWRMAKLNALGMDSLVSFRIDFGGSDDRLQAKIAAAEPMVSGICEVENSTEALRSSRVLSHRNILISVLGLLKVNVTNVTRADIDQIFHFDFRLCAVTKVCRDMTSRKEQDSKDRATLFNLADVSPQINWIRWRNILFSEIRTDFPHDKVHIYADGFVDCIEKLNDLLYNTSSKVLTNYLSWKFVLYHLGFLGKPFRQILENNLHLFKKVGDWRFSDRWIPRWRQCISFIKEFMPMSVLKEYREFYHDDDTEKEKEDLVRRVKHEFRTIMKNAKNLLESDRDKSYRKIDRVQIQMAYPVKDDKFYKEFYSGLGRVSDSFLRNGMKLMTERMRRLMEGVIKSKSVYDLEYAILQRCPPFELTAYSLFRNNMIVLTLPFLQAYSVFPTFPKFKTMSTFGWTVGHQLAHGFDLRALNMRFGSNWTQWSNYVLKQARTKADCFIEYFALNSSDNRNRNTESVLLNEYICDSQALYLAFKAYQNFLTKYRIEETLPGLSLSNMKLFFISYAQQFCEIRKHSAANFSQGRQRVNQVLKNFPEFSEVFRCPKSSSMNFSKCDVLWS